MRRSAPFLLVTTALLFCIPGDAAGQVPPVPVDTLLVRPGTRISPFLPLGTRGIEVVSRQDIVASPARNLPDLLAWALGLEMLSRSAVHAEPRLRGSTPEQVLVLIDGLRIGDGGMGSHAADISIPLEEVEQIEILRGSASAAYGTDAVGGVINIVTRRNKPLFFGRVEGGSFDTRVAILGGRLSNSGRELHISAEQRESDGHRHGTDFNSRQARAGLRMPIGTRELHAWLSIGEQDFGAAGFHAPYPPYDAYHEVTNVTASFALESELDNRLVIEPRFRFHFDRDNFLLIRNQPSFFRTRQQSRNLSSELVARYQLRDNTVLAGGLEGYFDRLDGSSPGLPGNCSLTRLCRLDEWRTALFAEVATGNIGTTAATVGLRADWHSEYGTFFAPSIAGAMWPSDAMRLHASTGRIRRAPTWSERYYRDPANSGNPDLRPEEAWTAEVGATLSTVDWFRFSFAGFARKIDTLIDWTKPVDQPDTTWNASNVTNATFDGIEVEATMLDIWGMRISARASGVTHNADDREEFRSRYAFRPLTRIMSLSVDRELPARMLISTRVLHGRRQGESGFLRADARLSLALGERARFYVDALNFTDEKYLDITASPEPGFSVFIGAAWGWNP